MFTLASSTISHVISRDALKDVALTGFKVIENIPDGLSMRMDNGSIFLSKEYWNELKRLGIEPEFTPIDA